MNLKNITILLIVLCLSFPMETVQKKRNRILSARNLGKRRLSKRNLHWDTRGGGLGRGRGNRNLSKRRLSKRNLGFFTPGGGAMRRNLSKRRLRNNRNLSVIIRNLNDRNLNSRNLSKRRLSLSLIHI